MLPTEAIKQLQELNPDEQIIMDLWNRTSLNSIREFSNKKITNEELDKVIKLYEDGYLDADYSTYDMISNAIDQVVKDREKK